MVCTCWASRNVPRDQGIQLIYCAMAKLEVSLSVEQRHLDWLQSMSEKYSLPTADKALRIVIVYAKQQKDSQDLIFKQTTANISTDGVLLTGKHQIDEMHDSYLEEAVTNYKFANKDKALQTILEYVMSQADEREVFEVKRCRHGETCKNC